MNKAPGLKIIIIIFIIFILSIFLYFIWYLKIDKLTIQKLHSLQNSLKQQNINFEWSEYKKSGFPYRIETNLKNIEKLVNEQLLRFKPLLEAATPATPATPDPQIAKKVSNKKKSFNFNLDAPVFTPKRQM